MPEPQVKPSRKWYFLAAGLLLASISVAVWGIWGFVCAMMSCMGEQVVVPGSGEITLQSGGGYNIVHELGTVGDEGALDTSPMPSGLKVSMQDRAPGEVGVATTSPITSGLKVSLQDLTTGKYVPLRTVTEKISMTVNSRHGVVVMDFTVPSGGKYLLAGEYAPGQSGPKVVLSVGNEISGAVIRFVVTTIVDGLALLGAVAIFIAVPVLRARNRRRLVTPPPIQVPR